MIVNIGRKSGTVDKVEVWETPRSVYFVDSGTYETVWLTEAQTDLFYNEIKKNPDGSCKIETCWSPYLDPMYGQKERQGVPSKDFYAHWIGVGIFKDLDHVLWHIDTYSQDPVIEILYFASEDERDDLEPTEELICI
jgi:hypothetical protein